MTTLTIARPKATHNDLLRYDGKAELINGEIVPIMGNGLLHCLVAGKIFRALNDYALQRGEGLALGDNMVYAIKTLPSKRQSFTPDVSFYLGKLPEDMEDFIQGSPTFAIEIRGKEDRGPYAERKMAEKRADYFDAGTEVVWDVNPVAKTVTRYLRGQPGVIYAIGQKAEAEPALPGWHIQVADIFA